MRLPMYHFWSTVCAQGDEHLLDLTEWESSMLALPFLYHHQSRDVTAALCYSAIADDPTQAIWTERFAALWTLRAQLGTFARDGDRSCHVLRSFVARFVVDGSDAELEKADIVARVDELAAGFENDERDRAANRTTLERALDRIAADAALKRLERLGCLRRLEPGERDRLVDDMFSAQHTLFSSRNAELRARESRPSDPVLEAVMHRLNARGVALAFEHPSRSFASVWRDALAARFRGGKPSHDDFAVDPNRGRDFDYVRGVMVAALRRDRREHAQPPAASETRRYELGGDSVELRGPTPDTPCIYVAYDGSYGAWLAGCDDARRLTHEPHPLPVPGHLE